MESPGRDDKNEHQSRARRAKRGRGRQTVVKAVLESEPAVEPQPDPQEKAEPVPSEPALPEPVHQPVHQQQPPLLTIENTVSGMEAVAVEGELADGSLDPAGELPQSCWSRGGLGSSAVLSAKGAHLIHNDPTASPGHGAHKTRVAETGGQRWWDCGDRQFSPSPGIRNPLLSVLGVGLWTWSSITLCPKNSSVALPRVTLAQGDMSMKISSLLREDVVFWSQSWLGERKSRHALSTVHAVSGLTLGWWERKVGTGTRSGCLQATTPLKPARTEGTKLV